MLVGRSKLTGLGGAIRSKNNKKYAACVHVFVVDSGARPNSALMLPSFRALNEVISCLSAVSGMDDVIIRGLET